MHPSTEDLLTLRDGDAADADKLARWRAVPGSTHAVARLERMRDALRALPELDPPADAWQAIEARLIAAPTERVVARGAVAARVVGLAAALVLAVIAVLSVTSTSPPGSVPGLRTTSRDAGNGELLGDSLRRVPERLEQTVELSVAGGGVADRYTSLEQESAALEQMLGAISFQRAAMSGATASAIAGLEDRIALIDAYLLSTPLPADARAPLMRVRVDLLAALVSVRLAQAQPLSF